MQRHSWHGSNVSEKCKVVISERLNDAINKYLNIAKKCTQTLIDLVFNNLKLAMKWLFGAAASNIGHLYG